MKKFWGMLAIALGTLVLDQVSKQWAFSALPYGIPHDVTPFFALTHIHNTGTAFGLFAGNNKALVAVATVILGFVLYSARGICEKAGWWGAWGIGLVVGGAIGNLVDRVRLGHVIDFLDFRVWPVFNLADTAISIGAACLMIGLWRDKTPETP